MGHAAASVLTWLQRYRTAPVADDNGICDGVVPGDGAARAAGKGDRTDPPSASDDPALGLVPVPAHGLRWLARRVPQQGHDYSPAPEEWEQMVAAMRDALGDADEVDRQLTRGGEEGVTETQCRRWLRARGWDPVRAARDLAAHAAWRAEFVPGGRIQEAEVARELAQRKAFLQGPDRKGRGITVFVGANHLPRDLDPAETQRFIVYACDATVAIADPVLNPAGKTTGVFCMGGFGLRNFDVMGAIGMARAVHQHYVERIDVLYIHGTSTTFQRLYKLVEPCIDPVTRAKIVILPSDEAEMKRILDEGLGLENLPPFLGGTGEERPIEDAWALILGQAADAAKAAGAGPKAATLPGPRGANDEEGFQADEVETELFVDAEAGAELDGTKAA